MWFVVTVLIARFMGPAWGPSGADRTHVGPMNLAIWERRLMASKITVNHCSTAASCLQHRKTIKLNAGSFLCEIHCGPKDPIWISDEQGACINLNQWWPSSMTQAEINLYMRPTNERRRYNGSIHKMIPVRSPMPPLTPAVGHYDIIIVAELLNISYRSLVDFPHKWPVMIFICSQFEQAV